MFFTEGEQCRDKGGGVFERSQNFFTGVKAQVERHLVVAAAAGVHLFTEVAEIFGQGSLDCEVGQFQGQQLPEAFCTTEILKRAWEGE